MPRSFASARLIWLKGSATSATIWIGWKTSTMPFSTLNLASMFQAEGLLGRLLDGLLEGIDENAPLDSLVLGDLVEGHVQIDDAGCGLHVRSPSKFEI
jgi:hypothetical protein